MHSSIPDVITNFILNYQLTKPQIEVRGIIMEGNLVEEEALAELGNSVGVISIPSSGAGLVSQPGPLGFI